MIGKIKYALAIITSPDGVHNFYLRRAIRGACSRIVRLPNSVALDYGCGGRPYDEVLLTVVEKVIGADLAGNKLADLAIEPVGVIPVGDASIDVVTSFQVLEHVPDPMLYFREIKRICKSGGSLLLSVPSIWPYHPHPTDYRRWMLDGLVYDLHEVGFEVIQTWSILNPVSAALQSLLVLVQYSSAGWRRAGRSMLIPFVVMMNALIVLSEGMFRRTIKFGAGNYVVLARRFPEAP